MIKILYYGNCQIGAIQKILKRKEFKGSYIVCYTTKIKKNDFLKKIKESDMIIMTFISENYRDKDYLSSKFIIENARKDTKIIIIPSLYFDYYYIDLEYIKNKRGEKVKIPIDYHHQYILESFKKKIPIQNIIQKYILNKKLITMKQLEEKKNKSLEELKKREMEVFIKYKDIRPYFFISTHDYILKHYKDKLLFYSMNHPTKYLFQYICQEILKQLNLPLLIRMDIDPLSKTKCILYQCIQKGVHFNINDYKPLIKNKTDLKEIIQLYYNAYKKIDL